MMTMMAVPDAGWLVADGGQRGTGRQHDREGGGFAGEVAHGGEL